MLSIPWTLIFLPFSLLYMVLQRLQDTAADLLLTVYVG